MNIACEQYDFVRRTIASHSFISTKSSFKFVFFFGQRDDLSINRSNLYRWKSLHASRHHHYDAKHSHAHRSRYRSSHLFCFLFIYSLFFSEKFLITRADRAMRMSWIAVLLKYAMRLEAGTAASTAKLRCNTWKKRNSEKRNALRMRQWRNMGKKMQWNAKWSRIHSIAKTIVAAATRCTRTSSSRSIWLLLFCHSIQNTLFPLS